MDILSLLTPLLLFFLALLVLRVIWNLVRIAVRVTLVVGVVAVCLLLLGQSLPSLAGISSFVANLPCQFVSPQTLTGDRGIEHSQSSSLVGAYIVQRVSQQADCDPPNLKITAKRWSQDERDAARYVASHKPSQHVVLRDPGIPEHKDPDGNTSDLTVDGLNYDIYTPEPGTSVNQILSAAAAKYIQARGVVIYLKNAAVTAQMLGNALGRVRGLIKSWGGDPNTIQEVMIDDPKTP